MRMKPLMKRLERETGVKVVSYETWHNKDNQTKYEQYDTGLCGGVPVFYNTDTKAFICGEADYTEVKKWAGK